MVARRYNDIGAGVAFFYLPTYIRNARGCIPAARLEQNITRRDFGELLMHLIKIVHRRYHPYILVRAYTSETVVSHLYQRASGAKHVKKLLGFLLAAHGPKPAAHSASHNHQMVVAVHIAIRVCLWCLLHGLLPLLHITLYAKAHHGCLGVCAEGYCLLELAWEFAKAVVGYIHRTRFAGGNRFLGVG